MTRRTMMAVLAASLVVPAAAWAQTLSRAEAVALAVANNPEVRKSQQALLTNQSRAQGRNRRDALIHAGSTRLRPIVMTTLAMIFGMLPLAFAIGAGAEMRAPMARAVIGGLITSTLLTLIVVPVVYTYLDDLRPAAVRGWFKWPRRRAEAGDREARPVAPAPQPAD
jgi:hypothetical protein